MLWSGSTCVDDRYVPEGLKRQLREDSGPPARQDRTTTVVLLLLMAAGTAAWFYALYAVIRALL